MGDLTGDSDERLDPDIKGMGVAGTWAQTRALEPLDGLERAAALPLPAHLLLDPVRRIVELRSRTDHLQPKISPALREFSDRIRRCDKSRFLADALRGSD
jgi:hypothetical protein